MVKQHLKELARRREALSSKAAYVFCFFFVAKFKRVWLQYFSSVVWRIKHYSVSFSLYSSLCYWSYEEIIYIFLLIWAHLTTTTPQRWRARLPWNNDQKLQWKAKSVAETGVMKLLSREIWGDQTWSQMWLVILRDFPRKHWGSVGWVVQTKPPVLFGFWSPPRN